MESAIAKSLKTVLERIQVAVKSSTKTKNCRLVGASKTKSVDICLQAYEGGLRHFGENYVDEIVEKSPKMPNDVNWHFIGHLQSNKVKQVIVPNLYMLETIDSIKLAEKVQKVCQKIPRNLKVLIQVKTSDEETKSGISREEAPSLVEYILTKCPNLEFCGVMTLGYEGDEKAFQLLYEVRKEICEKFKLDESTMELSMGMSNDFETAISHGATNVRVGSIIFGAREYPLRVE